MRVSEFLKSSFFSNLMRITQFIYLLIVTICLCYSCSKDEPEGDLELLKVFVGDSEAAISGSENVDFPPDRSITLVFSEAIEPESIQNSVILSSEGGEVGNSMNLSSEKALVIHPSGLLDSNTLYTIDITNNLKSTSGAKATPASLSFRTKLQDLKLLSVSVSGVDIGNQKNIIDANVDLSLSFVFSSTVNVSDFELAFDLTGNNSLEFSASDEHTTIHVNSISPLDHLKEYELKISSSLKGAEGGSFEGYSLTFFTKIDSTLKFPEISDEELLTKIQRQTFKYFWDFGHPVSGLARERNTSGETVTSGGSGFGLMAILIGIERGFITREEGITRLDKIITFLEKADRFHGAWPHWMNGSTGTVVPFSSDDDGGDLVETAFMVQGLLTVRQYLDAADAPESDLIDKINQLWETVEWDWYTQGGQNVLYWHWSPNFDWVKNHKITGWNEALIIYVLAASSPTHGIDAEVYTQGWARDGAIVNTSGNSYYSYTLDLRNDRGGPLFFAHYSFLGLDPRNLSDQYADYWDQNVNHSLINRAYCIANPRNYIGYKSYCWGLTASDNPQGYSAHSPDNDLGVITPTAAISSIPYTPEESIAAIRHFYYILGDRLWGEYGFYDAFDLTENWTASSYLAIDQGPIVVMIENYRTGLLWDLFMSVPEVQSGLDKLGFSYE